MPLEVTMAESSDSYLHEPDEWIPGQIVDIQAAPDTGFGPGFKWVIELDDAEEGDFDQWAFCSQTLSLRSKLYGWLTALGVNPQVGEKVDLAQLVGRDIEVMFERFEKDGVTKEKVVKIRQQKSQAVTRKPSDLQTKQTETKTARAPKRETTDFVNPDEAPF